MKKDVNVINTDPSATRQKFEYGLKGIKKKDTKLLKQD